MRFPQVIVYEPDGRLKQLLTAMIVEHRWVLREFRQVEACMKALSAAHPSLLVFRLSAEYTHGLEMLSRIARKGSKIRKVAVLDAAHTNELVGLAWDLGADFVLAPPLSLIMLPDIVAGLMLAVTGDNQVK